MNTELKKCKERCVVERQKKEQILIPEGCFEGYCGGCFHAKRKLKNSKGELIGTREGEIFCKRHEQLYPESDNGYNCYEGRIVGWIKMIIGIYIMLAVVAVILELIF